jgi:glycogen debranching enzyme
MLLHDLDDDVQVTEPTTFPESTDNGVDDNIHQLRYTIDEMFHQLTHLVRSQNELLEVIQENPTDEDFAEAYWENNVVIKNKRKRIEDLLAKLWNRDPVYFRKVDKLLSDLLPETPESEETEAINAVIPTQNDQQLDHPVISNDLAEENIEQSSSIETSNTAAVDPQQMAIASIEGFYL